MAILCNGTLSSVNRRINHQTNDTMSRRSDLYSHFISEEQLGVQSSRFPPSPAYHEILGRIPSQWRRLRPASGSDVYPSDRIVFIRHLDRASNQLSLPECDESIDAITVQHIEHADEHVRDQLVIADPGSIEQTAYSDTIPLRWIAHQMKRLLFKLRPAVKRRSWTEPRS